MTSEGSYSEQFDTPHPGDEGVRRLASHLPRAPTSEELADVRREISDAIANYVAEIDDGVPPALHIRVGRSHAFGVQDAVSGSYSRVLALLGALTLAGSMRNVLVAGTTLDLLRGMLSSWTHLTSELEQAVFESVAFLKAVEVVNYDALATDSLAEAVAKVGPTADDIAAHLGIEPPVIRETLDSLRQSGLVSVDRQDRWSIRF